MQVVAGAVFRTLHLPVLQGRDFESGDDENTAPVALVSRTLAARSWPGDSAVGKRIRLGSAISDAPWIAIVGVVDDVKQNWWDSAPRPVVYVPYLQTPRRVMEIEVRGVGDPQQLVPGIRAAVRVLSPSAALVSAQPLDASIADSLAPLRILRLLMSLFGTFATVLAAIGVFGILTHSVARRMHEFGVRAALGAKRADLLRLVFAQTIRFSVLGLGLGLPVAFIATTAMRDALPGFIGFDAASFFGFALLLAVAALAAGMSPALRAMRVDPSETLRAS
jgi:predicted lysophospholipase L1 biosynthesis ABC-type transport system permease subunit